MEPQMLTMIFNIVFFAIIGIIVLKSVIGIFKGVWKTSTSFIVTSILYILIIVFNTGITELVYNINLSSFNISFSLNEVSIQVGTIGQVIRDTVMVLAGESIELTPDSEIFVIFDNLAKSLMALFVFLIMMVIVTFLLAPLLSFILYHVLIKALVGKRTIKRHKLRVAGFFVNLVKTFVTVSLFISPLTALTNKVADSASKFEFENEQAETFTEYVNAYNNSLLAQSVSSIKVGEDSIDVAFTNYLTSFGEGDSKTSFLDEFGMLLDIAFEGIQEGVIDLSTFAVDYTKLLSKEFVAKVMTELATSKLVTSLLPVAISIVVNLEEIKNTIDLSEINWDDLNWGDELSIIGDVYAEFYETGIIKKFVVDQEDIMELTLDRQNYLAFHRTFEKLNESEILNEVLPYVFASFGKYMQENTDFKDIFPVDVESYREIDLGDELSALYDAVLSLSDLAIYSPLERNIKIGDFSNQETLNGILNFVFSEKAVDETIEREEYYYTTAIENNSDYPQFVLTSNDVFDGINDGTRNVYKGLLDSKLILNNIGGLLKYASNLEMLKQYNISEDLNDAVTEIENMPGDKKESWSKEIKSLLKIVSVVYNNEILTNNFDLFDDNDADIKEIRKILPYLDESILIKKVGPSLIESLINSSEEPINIFGLTASDLNFRCESLGTELGNLLDVIPVIGTIQSSLGENSDINSLLNNLSFVEEGNKDSIEYLLSTVYNSEILNPNANRQGMNNFETVLFNVLGDTLTSLNVDAAVLEDAIMSVRPDSQLKSLKYSQDNSAWINEIKSLCEVFDVIKNSSDIKELMGGATIEIAELADEVEGIFTSIDYSIIFSNIMGDVLNSLLGPTTESMNLIIDFNKVESWTQEGACFARALNAMNNLDTIDFSNFDVSSLKVEHVDSLELILRSLYSLESVDSTSFGTFVYENITKTIFGSYIESGSDVELKVKEDHYIYTEEEAMNSDGSKTLKYFDIDNVEYVMWNNPQDNVLNPEGKNDVIGDMMKLVRIVIEKGLITSEGINESVLQENLGDIITSINEIYIFRSLIGEVISSTIDGLSFEGNSMIDFSYLNSQVFDNELKMDNLTKKDRVSEIEVRQNELDNLVNLFEELTENSSIFEELDLTKLDTLDTEPIGRILTYAASSKMFNTINPLKEDNVDQLTFFQNILVSLFIESGLGELMAGRGIDQTNKDQIIRDFVVGAITDIDNYEGQNDWLTTDGKIGQIDLLINAIEVSKEVSSFFTSEQEDILTTIEPIAIKNVLQAFSKCDVFVYKNAIGNIMNYKLIDTFELVGLHVDFTKVGSLTDKELCSYEWGNDIDGEAVHVYNLLKELKTLSGEGNKVTFGFDLKTVDTEILLRALIELHDLRSVQRNNDYFITNDDASDDNLDNFGSFVFNQITYPLFGEYIHLEDVKENGIIKFSKNIDKVYDDHALDTKEDKHTFSGSLETNDLVSVTWKDRHAFVSQSEDVYTGELEFMCEMVKFAQEKLMNVSGEFEVSQIAEDLSLLQETLVMVNKSYPFRTILATILSESLHGDEDFVLNDVIDFHKANTDYFINDLNYHDGLGLVKNRSEEISAREQELQYIGDMLQHVDGFTSINSDTIDAALVDDIIYVLRELEESEIFSINDPKYVSIYGETTTIFEDVIKLIMDKTTLTDMIVKNGVDKNENVIATIKNISKHDSWSNNHKELDKLEIILKDIVSLRFNDISDITSKDLTKDEVSKLMTDLNNSMLCHGALANVVNEIYSSSGIASYALEGEIDASILDEYEFSKSVMLWNEDIVHLASLYSFMKNGLDLSNINADSTIFEDVLPHLMVLNTLGDKHSDVLYGIFKDAGVETYVSPTLIYNVDYVQNGEITIADYQRRDTLKYLIENRISNWDYESSKIAGLIDVLLENNNLSLEDDNLDSGLIVSIFNLAYDYDLSIDSSSFTTLSEFETLYSRAYIASEFVCSFLEQVISNVDDTISLDYRGNDFNYIRLNRFESDGLKGIIEVSKNMNELVNNTMAVAANYASWKATFKANMALMGNLNSKTERSLYLNDEYNSISASRLFNVLLDDEIRTKVNNVVAFSGKSLNWDLEIIDGRYQTFEEKADEWIITFDETMSMLGA